MTSIVKTCQANSNHQMQPTSTERQNWASNLHAQERLERISLCLWQKRSVAVSSRWHRGSSASILAPASSWQCTHPLLPLQPGSAAPREAPGSFCSDGSASCHISHGTDHLHITSVRNTFCMCWVTRWVCIRLWLQRLVLCYEHVIQS